MKINGTPGTDCRILFSKGLAALNLAADALALDNLCCYLEELAKWNRKINLVGPATPTEMIDNHFLDSLTLLPLLPAGAARLLDIGSGAGFPGLPLKILQPDLEVTLVEPREKRVAFLRQVIRTVKLAGVKVMAERLEADDSQHPELHNRYEIVTSRAFTAIGPFLAIADRFNVPGGLAICMKGRKSEDELHQWRQESPTSPYRLDQIIETTLPFSGKDRKIITFKKIS